MTGKRCAYCNEPFKPTNSRHIYCTDVCKKADWWRKRNPITPIKCERCNKIFTPTNKRYKYCSADCAEETNRWKARLLIFKNRRLYPELYMNEIGSKYTSTNYKLARDESGEPDFDRELMLIRKEKNNLGLF